MTETTEQYVSRLLGYLGSQDPLAVLEATPSALASLVEGVDEKRLRTRPPSGKWSMAEVAIHLSEAELVIGYRVRKALGASGTSVQGYDEAVWATRYDRASVPKALALQRALREANLALYRSLTSEEWARFSMHNERGKETVEQTVRLAAGHDLNHLRQLQALRG
jgi:hypothetical protein